MPASRSRRSHKKAFNQPDALCSTFACMHALSLGEGVVPGGRVLPYEGFVEAQPGARVALGPRSKVPA
jgi:hypothetical protein